MLGRLGHFILKIYHFFTKYEIPFLGISIGRLVRIYVKGIAENKIPRLAAGISWNFFMSLFPFLFFMLSLLPYFPHYEQLQFYVLNVLLANILPTSIQEEVKLYIEKSLLPNISGINNLTLVLVLIFGTIGTHALINGFNISSKIKRPYIKEFIIALGITLSFILLIAGSILGIYYSEVVQKLFIPDIEQTWLLKNLSVLIGYVSFPIFYFLLLSLFYWVGCIRIVRLKEAFPGALFTTILFIGLTYGFAVYVKNFARYNVLYGSIGSILLFMVWLNVNINLVLLGNELNVIIKKVRLDKLVRDELKQSSAANS